MIKKIRNKFRRIFYLIENSHNYIINSYYVEKRRILEYSLLHSVHSGIELEVETSHPQLIISLTSFGKRIEEVWLTIESLMQQSRKANKILLWLAEEDYEKPLPASLLIQQQKGLEIKKCKDVRSYKKLIYTLKEYPDAIIMTVDDDAIYEFDLIDRFYRSYLNHPNSIHAGRTHVMSFDQKGKLKPYNEWKWWSAETEKPQHLFFTGVGGVLYPPHSLDSEVLNEEAFTKLAPYADDVWFNAMALKNGTKIIKVATHSSKGEDYLSNESVQDVGLMTDNTVEGNRNDKQIKAVYERYDLLKLL